MCTCATVVYLSRVVDGVGEGKEDEVVEWSWVLLGREFVTQELR